MKKITISLIILTIALIGIFIFINLDNSLLTGRIVEKQGQYLFTKAICDETNYCEDYEIECNKNEVVKMTATGYSIQDKENRKDPRGEQDLEKLCG